MPTLCRCGAQVVWDGEARGFVCPRSGARPWRCRLNAEAELDTKGGSKEGFDRRDPDRKVRDPVSRQGRQVQPAHGEADVEDNLQRSKHGGRSGKGKNSVVRSVLLDTGVRE